MRNASLYNFGDLAIAVTSMPGKNAPPTHGSSAPLVRAAGAAAGSVTGAADAGGGAGPSTKSFCAQRCRIAYCLGATVSQVFGKPSAVSPSSPEIGGIYL